MRMEFNANSPILFLLAGIIILAVVAQSVFFLVRAWRRGAALGMDISAKVPNSPKPAALTSTATSGLSAFSRSA